MIHIVFAVPHTSFIPLVEQAWAIHEKEFGETQAGYEFRHTVVCEPSPARIIAMHYNDADVIVSRGGTATGLKAQNRLTPVIEIPISCRDMETSVAQAIREHGKMPIAAVGTSNMVYSVKHLIHDLPVPVKPYTIATTTPNDIRIGVDCALADGYRLIIGGAYTCEYTRERGAKAGLLLCSVESIFQSITEAKRCAVVSYAEREKSLLFRAIVDHVVEGVIAVNSQNLICTFNPAAAAMLERNAGDCIGLPANQALPKGHLSTILQSKQPYTNEIIHSNGTNFLLNSVPMEDSGRPIGTLVTFQTTRTITDAESRIRDQLHARGHMAKYHFSDVLGESAAILASIHQAKRFAPVDSNILLYGETGTGKELFAQSIHNESNRVNDPFVAVNCAAIPENLMESELFGYEGGSFTGANKVGKSGLFEAAHKGTIFLDEISEIPLSLQNRLLRVIQEREVRRIGSDRVTPVDVRIICATNRNLMEMIGRGEFREDLYYRLKVLSVTLPPLRERTGDVQLLMQYYLRYYTHRFGKGEITLSPAAVELANAYAWPGNLRELRNISEQLAVLCEGSVVTPEALHAVLPTRSAGSETATGGAMRLNDMERQRIIEAVARTRNRKEAAALLGISKTTLWRKCKEYEI